MFLKENVRSRLLPWKNEELIGGKTDSSYSEQSSFLAVLRMFVVEKFLGTRQTLKDGAALGTNRLVDFEIYLFGLHSKNRFE